MNRFLLLTILILFSFTFGQRFDSRTAEKYTFSDAVNNYNHSKYLQTKHMLQNLPFDEQLRYEEDIELLLMKTEYHLNNYYESRTIGKKFLQNYPNSQYSADIHLIFGDIFFQENMFESAYRSYIKSLENSEKNKVRDKAVQRIFKTLQYGISEQIIDELLLTEIDNYIIQVLLISKAHVSYQNGESSLFKETMGRIDRSELKNITREYFNNLYDYLNQEQKNIIVPVILPLSGKDSKIGIEFLDGLKFAQLNNTNDRSDISFVIYDNESDQLNTIKLFDKIQNNKNVSAILGPIENESSIIAGSYATQFDIPIFLPNTVNDELSNISDNLIFLNSDLEMRGRLAAQTIYNEIQAANIAVLAPANGSGKRTIEAFTNELSRFGVEPLVVEWYAGIPMNLDRQFKAIRNKAWELKALSDTMNISNRPFFSDQAYTSDTTFLSDSTYKYESIIDSMLAAFKAEEELLTKADSAKVILNNIDAIYMPINSNDLEYIGAQFPAYNLETVVVGNEYWIDLNMLKNESIGPHLKGMIVISNYSHHKINELNTIIDQKRTQYFYQAIDAYNLLSDVLTSAVDQNMSIRQLLQDSYFYMGVFGVYNFENGNNVNSNLNILEFDGRKFDSLKRENQFIY